MELFFWPTPNGLKISIVLEEMAIAYRLRPIDISRGEQHGGDFISISPNGRIPAIIDPDGPGGEPISVFESGAILQYLGRKTGRFYGRNERERIAVEEWLMWQMAGLGPMSGQYSHFRNYAPALVEDEDQLIYARERYTREVLRLYGVINERLAIEPFLASDYSIADIAAWPWIRGYRQIIENLDQHPHLACWFDRVATRPAVQRAIAIGAAIAVPSRTDEQNLASLFGKGHTTGQ